MSTARPTIVQIPIFLRLLALVPGVTSEQAAEMTSHIEAAIEAEAVKFLAEAVAVAAVIRQELAANPHVRKPGESFSWIRKFSILHPEYSGEAVVEAWNIVRRERGGDDRPWPGHKMFADFIDRWRREMPRFASEATEERFVHEWARPGSSAIRIPPRRTRPPAPTGEER